MTELLRLENIAKHYVMGDTTVRALDGVSLTINQGEFVAIMGQSGSGKSTLMNVLGCLDTPSNGAYFINGRDVSNFERDDLSTLRRETFGFVFQRYNLLATSTAAENVEIPAIYAGMSRSQRHERARELLATLGLGDRTGNRPSQLSGGQQQRVAIARALMNNPRVILADEPTGALDSATGAEVMALLKKLHQDGRTVILITHDKQIASHAKRIIHIQDGKILEDNTQPHETAVALAADKKQEPVYQNLMQEILEASKMALRALRVNLFRTALTLLGIIIGVAAVVTMLAIGNGSKQKVIDQISAMGTNQISIRPGLAGFRGSGDIATMTLQDTEAIAQLPNVSAVVPERSTSTTMRFGNKDYMTTVQGTGAAMPLVNNWNVATGNFYSDADLRSYAPVVVLGQTVVDKLIPAGIDPIGKQILIKNIPFEIIGIMEKKGASWGRDQDDAVFIPLSTGLIRIFGQNYITGITALATNLDLLPGTQEDIRQLLIERHRGVEDFNIRNMS